MQVGIQRLPYGDGGGRWPKAHLQVAEGGAGPGRVPHGAFQWCILFYPHIRFAGISAFVQQLAVARQQRSDQPIRVVHCVVDAIVPYAREAGEQVRDLFLRGLRGHREEVGAWIPPAEPRGAVRVPGCDHDKRVIRSGLRQRAGDAIPAADLAVPVCAQRGVDPAAFTRTTSPGRQRACSSRTAER